MRVRHSLPSEDADEHELSLDCPCGPDQSVTAAPLRRPVSTLTHHRLTTQEKP